MRIVVFLLFSIALAVGSGYWAFQGNYGWLLILIFYTLGGGVGLAFLIATTYVINTNERE